MNYVGFIIVVPGLIYSTLFSSSISSFIFCSLLSSYSTLSSTLSIITSSCLLDFCICLLKEDNRGMEWLTGGGSEVVLVKGLI